MLVVAAIDVVVVDIAIDAVALVLDSSWCCGRHCCPLVIVAVAVVVVDDVVVLVRMSE